MGPVSRDMLYFLQRRVQTLSMLHESRGRREPIEAPGFVSPCFDALSQFMNEPPTTRGGKKAKRQTPFDNAATLTRNSSC